MDSVREEVPILQKDDHPMGDHGCTLKWDNVHYYINPSGCGGSQKHILHGISGIARPGEVIAIMGPSGSGKTTLLNILAQRISTGRIAGKISINDQNPERVFRKCAAYVAQEDILYPDLTVRETLYYAALLRLPWSISIKEKNLLINQLLDTLGLTHVQHTRIGGIFLRGISGGEKRRVSIGIELITSPSLLLADEPTSGLDSHAAASVMDILIKMAHQGATVVTTIHQPSSQIYQRFDKLLLLAKGNTMFSGIAHEAVDHFASVGFSNPPGWNPADYFLDIVSDEQNHPRMIEASKQVETRRKAEIQNSDAQIDPVEVNPRYSQSEGCFGGDQKIPWLFQFLVLSHRNFKRQVKNPMFLAQMIGTYMLSAMLMGVLFSNLQSNYENQLTLCIGFMMDVFGINAFFAVGIFIQDSAVYRREHCSGYYSASAYYLSRVLCSLPANFFVCFLYTAGLFWWVGLGGHDWSKFGQLLILNYLNMETFLAMNEIFGTIFSRFETAILFAGVANTLQMLLNGMFVNYPNIPVYMRWCYWSAFMTYSVSGVMLLQYNDYPAGQQWLSVYGVQIEQVSTCIYALLLFLFAFRLLGYIVLRFFGKKKG